MASSNISDPGYGWTTIKRKELVVLEEGGRAVTDLDVIEGFPTNFPAEFIRKFCLNSGFSCRLNSQKFSMAINDVLRSYFSSSPFEEEYIEFQSSGKSNGRQMKWDIMNIQPNTSFRLHAHPNIEIIYVIQGAIHEYRYEVPILQSAHVFVVMKIYYDVVCMCVW